MIDKTREFLKKYEIKIVLILGFLLVSAISFEAGILRGHAQEKPILTIEKPILAQNEQKANEQSLTEASKTASEASKTESGSNTLPQDCAFLGSKNSNKYHLPTCRWAKSIKPENRVCFSSENEAKSRGYVADKNCIK